MIQYNELCIHISAGNGSTEMRELNYSENHSEYSANNQNHQNQRPLQQIYHNKTDEDSSTVKQVTIIKVLISLLFLSFNSKYI